MNKMIYKRWLSLLLCVMLAFSTLSADVLSFAVYAADADICSHDYQVETYPDTFGGTCTVRCGICGTTDRFATSTGMYVFWNTEQYGTYSTLLPKTVYGIEEQLYVWIEDYDEETLVPNEKTVTVSDVEGVTFTQVDIYEGMLGYFTFHKPGIYTLTFSDRYNPLVTASYTVTVIGSGNGSGGGSDNGCKHQYKAVVTSPGCLVQGYTTYTCEACDDQYLGDFTDPHGHDFGAYVSNGDGTLTSSCIYGDVADTIRDVNFNGVLTEQRAYEVMVSLQDEYPEGMGWTDDDGYQWNGGIFWAGYGCAAFAFILSDAVFGNLPAELIEEDITIDMLHVGDILRVNNDSHSVIVLEVYDNYIVIAEGNYNASIHWGRIMTADEITDTADYVMTRYPVEVEEETTASGDVNGDGVVNAKDVAALRRHLAGGWEATVGENAADVNGDGTVNAKDVAALRRYLAGGWNITLQ